MNTALLEITGVAAKPGRTGWRCCAAFRPHF